jgi:ferric-dicitrate binding protein FerR (iron transport regulator)
MMDTQTPFSPDGFPNDALLAQWLTGHCTSDEQRTLDRWAADPAHAEWLAAMRDGYIAAGQPFVVGDVSAAVIRLRTGMALRDARRNGTVLETSGTAPQLSAHVTARRLRARTAAQHTTTRGPRLASTMRFRLVAGMAATAFCATALWFTSQKAEMTKPSPAPRYYATGPAQRATITLPDGSTALLGSSSRIEYSASFGTTAREVSVDGEVLFTVPTHNTVPFVVHAGRATTRVLGTVFAVRHYATDDVARVAVAEGKVSFHMRDDRATSVSRVLSTGDVAVLAADGTIGVNHHADIAKILGWTDSTLSFDHVALRDVIPDLEREYDLDFHVADTALLSEELNASFTTTTPNAMLRDLGFILSAKVIRNGRRVTLTALRNKGASSSRFVPLIAPPTRTSPLPSLGENDRAVAQASTSTSRTTR